MTLPLITPFSIYTNSMHLNNLIHWADSWQLKLNFDKCHMIHFGHKNSNFEYYFDMHKIGVNVKKF